MSSESCDSNARAGRAFCIQKNLPKQAANASELTTSIAGTVSLFGKNSANLSRNPVTNATIVALLNVLCSSFIFMQTAYGALSFNMKGAHNA